MGQRNNDTYSEEEISLKKIKFQNHYKGNFAILCIAFLSHFFYCSLQSHHMMD